MFRSEKRAEKALLGWNMLDHDDAATLDINDFDECSPLPPLSTNFHHGYISQSLSGSSPILEQKSKKLQDATAARSQRGRREPARQVAAPDDPLSDLPKVAVPVSVRAPEHNTTLCTTTCVTSDWKARFVCGVTQIGARGQSARKKRRNALSHQCCIDESSSSDNDSTADTSRIKTRTAGTCTEIEEVTEDELYNSVDHPREPRMDRMGTVSSKLQDSDCSTDTCDAENTLQKQDVVKNGFEELLLISRQKEMSELALWECYRKNANFPKTFSEAEALTARVVTLENVCGLSYCACEVVGPLNAASNVCVALPQKCAERELLDSGVVVRIYPPWREYVVPSCREKVISGVQFFKVLKRPSSDTDG